MSTIIQRSFAGGELTPSLYARTDITKYQAGLRQLRNFYVPREGGAVNRPGSQFIAEVKDSTKEVRLIPFIFNTEQTYVLEFGDQYMRVHKEGLQLAEAAKVITGITNANPAVVSIAAHGYTTGEEVFISGVGGMTEVNSRNFKVGTTTAGTFELIEMDGVTGLDSTGFGTYTTGGTAEKIYEIATPYLEDDLDTLQFIQSADIVTLTHPSYAPRELARTGDTAWTLTTITFAPSIAAPTGGSVSGTGGPTVHQYLVTAIDANTGEESLAHEFSSPSLTPPTSNPHTITWTPVAGANEYNVYMRNESGGVAGFVGLAAGASFVNSDTDRNDVDTTKVPPTARNPFNAVNDYPATAAYHQQRLGFARTNNAPETVEFSQIGNFKNFSKRNPIQDDDAFNFSLAGRQVNEIKFMVDIGRLVILTSGGEWAILGGDGEVMTPTAVNPRQYSYNGSGDLAPVVVGNTILYIQARGTIVRSLGFQVESDAYSGTDLTVFSSHLFDDYTLVDWSYARVPDSVLWAARSDGKLLGFTYIPEQEMFAWHRHDFENGFVENTAVVPEGQEDILYVVVRRTIAGRTVKYIERFTSRNIENTAVEDVTILDSHLTYDGRNTDTNHTMTLSGGTTWDYLETLTLTSSTSYFMASDVGKEVHLIGSDGTKIRFAIEGFTSGTVVTGKPNKTVPVSMRGVATSTWGLAITDAGGLWHLEGEDVSVFADGFVAANPNNEAYDIVTVTNGIASLDKAFTVIHIGIPITADLETLDVDTVNEETLGDKKKFVGEVNMYVEASRGIWAGPKPPDADAIDLTEGLTELKVRKDESYDDPVDLKTEVIEINVRGDWNSNGRVFVRQIDPIPLSILSILPSGLYPVRGG